MEQKIRDRLWIKKGYKIDKQFLLCLGDIFSEYDTNAEVVIAVICGEINYTFQGIAEFLDTESNLVSAIEEMTITARFPRPNKLGYDEVVIALTDRYDVLRYKDSIIFDFSNQNGYLIIKNKIERLMKNYELPYSFYAHKNLLEIVDMLSCVLFTVFLVIIGDTPLEKKLGLGVGLVVIILGMIYESSTFANKAKCWLFPKYEFEFGVNKIVNAKAKNRRNIIGTSIFLAILVGVFVNYLSKFLF